MMSSLVDELKKAATPLTEKKNVWRGLREPWRGGAQALQTSSSARLQRGRIEKICDFAVREAGGHSRRHPQSAHRAGSQGDRRF